MKTLFKTKYLDLREDNGWFYTHRGNCKGVVIIIPVIKKQEVLFLKTKRPPLTSEGYIGYNIELPAGLVCDENKEENYLASAKRELMEETGYICNNFELLSEKISTSAGMTDEISTIFLANIEDDTVIQEPVNDNGVIIDRIKVKTDDIYNFIKTEEKHGNTIGAQTLSALFLFLCNNNHKID